MCLRCSELEETVRRLQRELLDTTWQDHADHWKKRAETAEALVKTIRNETLDAAIKAAKEIGDPEAEDRQEREWKAGREGLTLEERIRALEHFMYHHGEHYEGPITF